MDALKIIGTETTFQVTLDKTNNIFEFSGKSRPENIMTFFEPIFKWFEKYELSPNLKTVINFSLDYFNSSTAKVLLRFLVYIEELNNKGIDIDVVWHYRVNDEDLKEVGEDFASLVSVPFKFVEFE